MTTEAGNRAVALAQGLATLQQQVSEGKLDPESDEFKAALANITTQLERENVTIRQTARTQGTATAYDESPESLISDAIIMFHGDEKRQLISEYGDALWRENEADQIEFYLEGSGRDITVDESVAYNVFVRIRARILNQAIIQKQNSPAKEKKEKKRRGKRFKKKKKRAEEQISEQSDQNFLLQNYESFKDQAPDPKIMPRLTIVKSADENLVNRLTVKDDMLALMNASAKDISTLVPYIRFFKRDRDNSGNSRLREFKFSKNSQNLKDYFSGVSGGSEIGLKSFNLEMIGRNDFTATRNFQGSLVLFFKSLADMDDTQVPEGELAWTDLLFNHMFEPPSSPDMSPVEAAAQLGPYWWVEAYSNMSIEDGDQAQDQESQQVRSTMAQRKAQIYVEFGYEYSDAVLDETREDLKNAVNATRMLVALNPISTNFTFGQDGSAELSVEFTSASESMSDDMDTNFLTLGSTSKELEKIKELEENINATSKAIEVAGEKKIKDLKDELEKAKNELSKFLDKNRASNYGRFIEYLYENNRLFSVSMKRDDYFKGTRPSKLRKVEIGIKNGKELLARTQEDLEKNNDDEYLDTSKAKWDEHTIGYFFLGDLLNYAAYCLVPPQQRVGMNDLAATASSLDLRSQSAEVVLGDYTYLIYPPEEFHDENPAKWARDAKFATVNLSKLPISYSLYHSFMRNNIIKYSGTVFTFDDFLKQVMKSLVTNAMNSYVKHRKAAQSKLRLERKGGMQIVRITGDAPKLREGRKDGMLIDLDGDSSIRIAKPNVSAFLTGQLTDEQLPSNYIILFGSRKPIVGDAGKDPVVDAARGIYHLVAGSRSGIVKNLNFKQTSSRQKEINLQKYFRDGQLDAVNILRMPYDADVTIFGNPGFHPGQYAYLRPSYVGLGSVGAANSLANRLGLGGLYSIIGVSTRLTPGSLETTLTCIQNNNGYTDTQKQNEVSESSEESGAVAGEDKTVEEK